MYESFEIDEWDEFGQFDAVFYDADEIDYAARRRRSTARGLIPRNLRGASPNITHWWKVANIRNRIRRWFPGTLVRVDKDRREHGRPASKKRPDIQFRNPQSHRATHVEVDTDRRNMNRHIAERDPRRRGVFVLIDGNTGRVIEKQIFPAGSSSPIIRQGELTQRDVFDDYDSAIDYGWWDTAQRWGCRAKCSWLYGEGCTNRCGFNYDCVMQCVNDLYACNADCDKRYP